MNFKARHLKFYRHGSQDFRSSCLYLSNWNAFSKFLMVNIFKRLLAGKICFRMLLRKMNMHCLFNISNNVESCESLSTQVLWKPMSAEDRGRKVSVIAYLH